MGMGGGSIARKEAIHFNIDENGGEI